MTISKNISKQVALWLAVVCLLASCARPPAGVKEAPAAKPASTGDSRGFDPLDLPADREIVPAKYPRTGAITGRQALVSAGADNAETDTIFTNLENFVRDVDTLNNQAFRVQIYTSPLYQEARNAERVAEEIFDQPVYVEYEVPNFKVRVGDFSNREDAEKYAQQAKAAGYTSAWVVMVNIDVQEAAPLYEEPSGLYPDERVAPADSLESPGPNE